MVGFHIPDTRQNAINGAKKVAAFVDLLLEAKDLTSDISNLVETFSKKEGINQSYCVQYY